MGRKKKQGDDAEKDVAEKASLVGRRVQKEFEGFGKFTGSVLAYNANRGFYKVVYDDGDREELEFHELEQILVDASRDVAPPAKKRGRPPKKAEVPDSSAIDASGSKHQKREPVFEQNAPIPRFKDSEVPVSNSRHGPSSQMQRNEGDKIDEVAGECKSGNELDRETCIRGSSRKRRRADVVDVPAAKSSCGNNEGARVRSARSLNVLQDLDDEESAPEDEGDNVGGASSGEDNESHLSPGLGKERALSPKVGEELNLPALEPLPPSSGDISMSEDLVPEAFAIYSFLRSFSHTLFLSPFSLEDFLSSLMMDASNNLTDCIHLVLLQALRRHLQRLLKEDCSKARECLRQRDWNLLDNVTWPAFLMVFLATHGFGKFYGQQLSSLGLLDSEYYKSAAKVKLAVLSFLCDHVMDAEEIRVALDHREEELIRQKDVKSSSETQDKPIPKENVDEVLELETGLSVNHPTVRSNQEEMPQDGNSDECVLCGMNGNLICCDGCPAAYHSRCVGISRTSLPPGDWFCPECVVVKLGGEQSRPIVGLAGSQPLGVDPYARTFMAACGRLLVLEQYNCIQCSYKYYGRDDIPKVLHSLDMLTPFCDKVANAIRAHWGMPTKNLAESNSSQIDPKNKEVTLGPNNMPSDKGMIRKEEKDTEDSSLVPDILVSGPDQGPLDSIFMPEVMEQMFDHVDTEDCMVAGVDSGHTAGKLIGQGLISEGASPPNASANLMSHEVAKPIEGHLIFPSNTWVEGPGAGLSSALREKVNGRVEPRCQVLVKDPYLAQNVAERDSKGKFLNAASRDHVTPFSFQKPALWEHNDTLRLQSLALYTNHYTFGDAAATAAANLALMTAEEPLASGKVTKKKVTTIAEQINAFCKAPTRFCWPSWKKKLMDIPKDRCGWCFSCTVCLKRGCLLNQAASQLAAGAARVAGGIRPGKSGSGHLPAIVGYLLHMEESVHNFLMGPWENVLFRKQWRKKLEQAFSVTEFKSALLDLEAHLRPVVLTEDWSKALEDAPTLVLGGTTSPPVDESLSRRASGRKVSRRSGVSRREPPKSGNNSRGVVNWARRGKVAHRVSGWAILSGKVASKAGRQGGVKKIPGITYLESEEVPKRSKQTVWCARVQAARTIADLALQVRYLDCLFRWDDLSTKIEVPSATNEENDGMMEVTNTGIYAKANREKALFYLIDTSLIPRQGIRQNATFVSQLPKDLAEQCTTKRVWVEEHRVPLSLLRDFEDRERLSRQNEVPKMNALLKHIEARRWSRKKDIFGYLWERAGFSMPAKLVMSLTCKYCNLKVLASLAVQCHVCRGPFHKDCTVASHGLGKSEQLYTCCGCSKQTVGNQIIGVIGVNKQQLKPCPDVRNDAQATPIPPCDNVGQKRIVFIQPRPPQFTPAHTIRISMKPPLSSGSLGSEGKEFSKRDISRSLNTMSRVTMSESGVYMRKNGMDSRMRMAGKMLLPKQGDVSYSEAPKCYVCKQQYRGDLLYVKCERCPLWFHGVALGIDDSNVNDIVGFKCHKCRKKAIPVCPYGSKHRTHKRMAQIPMSTYNDTEEKGRFKDVCVTKRTPLPQLGMPNDCPQEVVASSTDIPLLGVTSEGLLKPDLDVKDEPAQLDFPQSSLEDSKEESSLDGHVLSDVKLEGADDSFDGDETEGKETVLADNLAMGDTSAQQPISFMELLSSEDDRVEELAELAMDFGGDGFDVFDVDSLMGSLGGASGIDLEERGLTMEDPNPGLEGQNAVQSMDAIMDVTASLNTAGCCGGSFPADLQCILCGLAFHQLCLGGGSGAGGLWTRRGWVCDACKNGIAQNQDDQKQMVDSLVDARILLQS